MCKKGGVESRSIVWDKHLRSKNHLIEQGCLPIREETTIFPSLRELAVSSPNKKNITVLGNKAPISPYYLVGDFQYPLTHNNNTLDSIGKLIQSILTTKPFDD